MEPCVFRNNCLRIENKEFCYLLSGVVNGLVACMHASAMWQLVMDGNHIATSLNKPPLKLVYADKCFSHALNFLVFLLGQMAAG